MAHSLAKVPKRRKNSPPIWEAETRELLYRLAATGLSRQGVCAAADIELSDLRNWINQGKAQTEHPVYGEFSSLYRKAERAGELACATAATGKLLAISKRASKNPDDITIQEANYCLSYAAQKFPREWGYGHGSGKMRELDTDMDPDEWWERHGLQLEQLRALLRDPPEAVAEALLAEGDAIHDLLLARGWTPRPELQRKDDDGTER